MTGNRNIVDVVLVGPRAKETCSLAGFDFVDGVAQVPAAAMTALNILAKYHSAYPRGSREHEDAEAKWERRSKGAAQGQADTEYRPPGSASSGMPSRR
ncbi:hypothetical protein QEG98_28320 [Myxococcus sp. MxC21-1]|uniref:hypothetical protein n=1 Tax=Myxococcus sp. MxC21-1 TaxID=3041439 RepID=UPI002931C57A|nr:hypothetical protein [Myxococcus sp. MxC21-1]WNZ59912.1 hypothetical protein QEG98_28320 [Myxococcus sp. MxC21-1]